MIRKDTLEQYSLLLTLVAEDEEAAAVANGLIAVVVVVDAPKNDANTPAVAS